MQMQPDLSEYICHYVSPLGGITLAANAAGLTGLWFDGQKYFGATLDKAVRENITAGAPSNASDMSSPLAGTSPAYTDHATARTSITDIGSTAADTSLAATGSTAAGILRETVEWLDLYFAGKCPSFTPPLAPKGTPFRQEVWQLLLDIPYGKTTTYGELAGKLAARRGLKSMSAQAVGGAVGHNPISLIIPCHRVLGSDGSLTGYAGGTDKKQALLELEKILVPCS